VPQLTGLAWQRRKKLRIRYKRFQAMIKYFADDKQTFNLLKLLRNVWWTWYTACKSNCFDHVFVYLAVYLVLLKFDTIANNNLVKFMGSTCILQCCYLTRCRLWTLNTHRSGVSNHWQLLELHTYIHRPTFIWQQKADWPLTCCNSVIKQFKRSNHKTILLST